MKKIVGILAAAAVLATSVFAADVSAKVRLDGEIFNYDGTAVNEKDDYAGAFRMLRTTSQARPYWSPYVTLSTSTDDAGAQILFIEEEDAGRNIQMDRSNVWFKPLDMLTVKVGWQDFTMNKESIDYNPNPTGTEGWGYGIGYAQDAISANVYLATGNGGYFFEDPIAKYGTAEKTEAYIKELYVNGAYAADFGTISAMFAYYGKSIDGFPTEAEVTAYVQAQVALAQAKAAVVDPANPTQSEQDAIDAAQEAVDEATLDVSINPAVVKFGAGYSNTIDNLSFFADVVATSTAALTDDEKDLADALGLSYAQTKDGDPRSAFGIMIDGFVKYDMDALTLKGYVRFDIDDFGHLTSKDGELKEDVFADNNAKLGLKFRADYKLDNGINLFAQFNNDNLLRKETTPDSDSAEWKDAKSVFASTIKLGANGSVGICDWETKLVFETGVDPEKGEDAGKFNKVNVSMPIWFQVAF